MHLNTILNKIQEHSTLDEFLNYIESQMLRGRSPKLMADEYLPRGLGPVAFKQLCDLWYPDYSSLSTKDRRLWSLTHYPVLRLERTTTWKYAVTNPTHPIYKHFTKFNSVNYAAQKSQAKKRGIDWKFDYLTWIMWWVTSGKFDQRGVLNINYQMCRKGDTGAYEWDNVYCDTGYNNKAPLRRPTVTPLGTFESVGAAAKHHNVTYKTMLSRIKSQADYYYVS